MFVINNLKLYFYKLLIKLTTPFPEMDCYFPEIQPDWFTLSKWPQYSSHTVKPYFHSNFGTFVQSWELPLVVT